MHEHHVQVAPSFFDAPGAQAAGKVTHKQKGAAGSPSLAGSPASTQRFSQDQPEVAFAVVSDFGYKVCFSNVEATSVLHSVLHNSNYKVAARLSIKDQPTMLTAAGAVMLQHDSGSTNVHSCAVTGLCHAPLLCLGLHDHFTARLALT